MSVLLSEFFKQFIFGGGTMIPRQKKITTWFLIVWISLFMGCSVKQVKDAKAYWDAVKPLAEEILNYFASPQFQALATAIGTAAGADEDDLKKAFFWIKYVKEGFELTVEAEEFVNAMRAKVEAGQKMTPEEAAKLSDLLVRIAEYARSKRTYDPELGKEAERLYEQHLEKERERERQDH